MTNAEKYEEVFGITPDKFTCPTDECDACPAQYKACFGIVGWWNEEYKEKENE